MIHSPTETPTATGDSRWPGLVTEVDHPNGWRVRATYDPRGNIASTTDYGFDGSPTTTYQWDQTWDGLIKLKRPEGDSLVMYYDPATGNRLWQQDGRGASTRVTFTYNSTNQPVTVTAPATPAESILYDVTAGTPQLGNVAVVKSPKGFDTQYHQDNIGRVTEIDARLDTLLGNPPSAGTQTYQSTWTYYDILDRDTLQITTAPNPQVDLNTWPETRFVRKRYNLNGQLDTLSRWAGPDTAHIGKIQTAWRHDLVGRVVAEIAPDGFVDSTFYDVAGNPDTVVTRNGKKIAMMYDPLNRLVLRTLPEVDYPSRHTYFGISAPDQIKDYAPYTISAETDTFSYDALGHLLTANNADARVRRSYFLDGLLKTDSSWIQTVNRDDWTKHVYGLLYGYDHDGRRITLTIPQQLAVSGNTTLTYGYEPQLGSLTTISDLLGNSYGFGYNAKGELTSTVLPASYSESFAYDVDGRLARDSIKNLGAQTDPRVQTGLVRAATFVYDGLDRELWSGDQVWNKDSLAATYSGLGHFVASKRTIYPVCSAFYGCGGNPQAYYQWESYTVDALGNRVRGWIADTAGTGGAGGNVWSTYQPGTGRLQADRASGVATNYYYDSAGAVVFQSNMGTPAEERVSYFAADGTLRAVIHRLAVAQAAHNTGYQSYNTEEFRYDALHRRIWVRAKNWCNDVTTTLYNATACRTSFLRRTLWDGDEELIEIQMPWGLQLGVDSTITTTSSWWENDVNAVSLGTLPTGQGTGDPNPYFGYVVPVSGPRLDHPVAITRVNYAMALDLIGRQPNQQVVAPFVIIPFWNRQGDGPTGVFGNGYVRLCNPPTSTSSCVGLDWPYQYSAYDAVRALIGDSWEGTPLESKRDKSGLSYMRNRYYDPATGRFTQEDPIGLAGGVNLYGYADGDPVNLSDPLGLCADDGGDGAADQGDQGGQGGDSTKAKPKPKPKPLSCHYQISTGHMTCQESGGQWNVVDTYGYSGSPGGYKNNPAMTSVTDKGPIPVGTYEMTPIPGKYKTKGYNVIRLTPMTMAFPRTGLLWHDRNPARPEASSTGCIVSQDGRSKVAAHGGGTLTVTP